MKPPETMPLPWKIEGGLQGFNDFSVWDKDGDEFEDTTPEDSDQAAAYIQHCVNVYPVLVEALSELYSVVKGESHSLLNEDSGGDAELDWKIQEALRKAGE